MRLTHNMSKITILTAQHSTAQHSTAQHSTAQHSTLDRRINSGSRQAFFDGLGAYLCS